MRFNVGDLKPWWTFVTRVGCLNSVLIDTYSCANTRDFLVQALVYAVMEGVPSTTIPTQLIASIGVHEIEEEHNIAYPVHSEQFNSVESSILDSQRLDDCDENDLVEVTMDVGGGELIRDMPAAEEVNFKGEFPVEPARGMEFETADAARAFYSAYADQLGFRVRNSKSFTSRVDDTVIMRRFVCSKQGRPTKKDPFDLTKKRRNRISSREGCKAMFQVNRRENGKWVVSRCVTEHCHSLGIVPKPSVAMLKKLAKKPWELLLGPSVSDVQLNGLGVGGGVVQSLLEYFKRMQSENPAFFYAIHVDKNNCVSNLFWADARARTAYSYFGDAVSFDMTCKVNRRMVPFAALTGVNHHRQLVVFGCAFLTDESEDSFIWLFQTWLTVMNGHYPISLNTGLSEVICSSAEKVLPNVRHRFCKWDVFHTCKEKLADVYVSHPTFKHDFKEVINGSGTPDQFEMHWSRLLAKYGVGNNIWLQQLYDIRQKWVPAFCRNSFFAEISSNQKVENMNQFFQRHKITTTTLRDVVAQFDKALAKQYEKELQADEMAYVRPVLKTPSPVEKQAADVYTKTIFDAFQDELVESSGFLMQKVEDGSVSKFQVTKVEDPQMIYFVTYNSSERMIKCNCCKFEFAGILCRHILRVCLMVGILMLPEEYILKRWTKSAKSRPSAQENGLTLQSNYLKALSWRCNDLWRDAIQFAEEGATSETIYKIAKTALGKAFVEVFSSKKFLKQT